jgi:hypothetical protein
MHVETLREKERNKGRDLIYSIAAQKKSRRNSAMYGIMCEKVG